MVNDIIKDAEQHMQKSIESLKTELSRLRTGRAHPSLLEHIHVSYYGSDVPLKQVANVAVEDARTLSITPWEKPMVEAIEKAIRNANLGLNPVSAGQVIRVPMPPLTEERRRDLIKVVREEGERGRIAIRSVRRDANNDIKDLHKEKEINEDDQRRAEEKIQKLTDKFIAEIDKVVAAKEADLLEV